VIAASGFVAWRLVGDETGVPGRSAIPRVQTGAFILARTAESLPSSLPSSRPESQPLALAPEPGAIRGKVVDRGGIPINHATVRFVLKVPPGQRNFALVSKYDETSPVDEKGGFDKTVPGGGVYQVVAQAEGFAPAVRDSVKPGSEIELMLDVGSTLAGIVVDRLTGKAIESAAVEVSIEKGAMIRKLVTSAAGEFRLQDLPAGKLAIGVDHDLYVPRAGIEQIMQAAEPASITIEMDSGKSIKGQVMAAEDSRPIEGAIVTVRKKKTVTDPTGRFVVRGLESENQQLQVAAEGYQADQRPVNLSGSRVEAVAEILLNRGATIRGRVQNEKGEPVPGAEIKLFETWGNWSYEDWATRHLSPKTNDEGMFKVSGIPGREWLVLSLRVRKEGYPDTFEKPVRVKKNDDDVFVLITVRTGAVIAGRVVDQENRPVAGARVELRTQNSGGWWMNQNDQGVTVAGTGAEGEFRFEGLGKAIYTLSAHVRGFSSAWKNDLDLQQGVSQTSVQLTVEAGQPVKGVVVDGEEKPIVGANVNVWTQRGNGQAVSDPEGKFVVESVPKGLYDVYASAAGYAATRLSKQTPAGDAGLRIVLKKEAVLKGTVIDVATRKPIERFNVALVISEENRQGSRMGTWGGQFNDKDGKFQVQAPQGTYRLEVSANGYVKSRRDGVNMQPGTEPEPVSIELKRGGAIEGILRGETGQPEPWVQTFVGKDDGSGIYNWQGHSENDGYFYVGDLDSGSYVVTFQKHGAPLLCVNGVYVGGEKPAYVEAQIERVARVSFDFALERPKDDEVVASATGEQPAAARSSDPQWQPPRVRVWVESVDGTPLWINQEWGGNHNEQKFKPYTRRDIHSSWRQEQFSVHVHDLPAGRFVLNANAKGYVQARVPFQIRRGARWRIPVQLALLPKEERTALSQGPRRHVGHWVDENNVRHEYIWYDEDE
jgi:protocatechuate 3,4-dioxygenase beta subunit